MSKNVIAVFAKTPTLSPVKTRLAATIGKEKAAEIYKICVDCAQMTFETFSHQNSDWQVIWALGEENAIEHDFWLNRPFDKIWTGDGALGTRLHTIYTKLKKNHDAVVLTSTDSPQLSPIDFASAAAEIKSTGSVIGPAHDGGYYLFGDTVNIPQNLWEAVPYSVEDTRVEFLRLLNKEIAHLTKKSDLDTIDDIQTILNEMPENKNSAQEKLIEMFKSL